MFGVDSEVTLLALALKRTQQLILRHNRETKQA